MNLSIGKFYVTRGGEKVGPLAHGQDRDEGDRSAPWPFRIGDMWYKEDGFSCPGELCSHDPKDDLVSEWIEGPVRTVTRREIVPGIYDAVHVGGLDAASHSRALIALAGHVAMVPLKADELRSAAMIFSQIAEVLDEQNADPA